MTRKLQVHIVGGGFSGMMAAYYCRQKGFEVTLSEGLRWGGLLKTERTEWGLVEKAASGFLRTELLESTARDLNVKLLTPLAGAKKRFIANEKPERLPVSWLAAIGGGIRYFGNKAWGHHLPRPQETLAQWANRTVGRSLSNRIVVPASQGIYGHDARHLSASLVLNPLFKKDRARRRGSCAPEHGMGQWTDALLQSLKDSGVQLREENLNTLPDADHVVLASSGFEKEKVLKASHPEFASIFSGLDAVPMTVVTVFFEKRPQDFPGFGILFHPDFGWKASGVLFENQIFSGRSPHRCERWFFSKPEALNASDDRLCDWIFKEREKLNGGGSFLGFHVSRWSRALPSYDLAWEKSLSKIQHLPRGLYLLGNEMGEIGLTSLAEKSFALADTLEKTHG